MIFGDNFVSRVETLWSEYLSWMFALGIEKLGAMTIVGATFAFVIYAIAKHYRAFAATLVIILATILAEQFVATPEDFDPSDRVVLLSPSPSRCISSGLKAEECWEQDLTSAYPVNSTTSLTQDSANALGPELVKIAIQIGRNADVVAKAGKAARSGGKVVRVVTRAERISGAAEILASKGAIDVLAEQARASDVGEEFAPYIERRLAAIKDGNDSAATNEIFDLSADVILKIGQQAVNIYNYRQSNQIEGSDKFDRQYLAFFDDLSKIDSMLSDDELLERDLRARFLKHYREHYYGAYLLDLAIISLDRDIQVNSFHDKVITEILLQYRHKAEALMFASNSDFQKLFETEVKGTSRVNSGDGTSCRKSSLLWGGRNVRTTGWSIRKKTYSSRLYRWSDQDYKDEIRFLNLIMAVKRTPNPNWTQALSENGILPQDLFCQLRKEEMTYVSDRIGSEYQYDFTGDHYGLGVSNGVDDNYCEILTSTLTYRQNLPRDLLSDYLRHLMFSSAVANEKRDYSCAE